jgi:hypothetical protein
MRASVLNIDVILAASTQRDNKIFWPSIIDMTASQITLIA